MFLVCLGGPHVTYIADQLAKYLLTIVEKKKDKKDTTAIKPQHIKNHLFIFLNCAIENPAFDSQMKETMTTKVSGFGSTCKLDEKFLAKGLSVRRS